MVCYNPSRGGGHVYSEASDESDATYGLFRAYEAIAEACATLRSVTPW